MRLAALLTLVAMTGVPIRGQQKPETPVTPPHPPAIKARAEEVLLDIIVRDKHGRPVRDLVPDEIQVLEDGVPQQITDFRLVKGDEILRLNASEATKGGAPQTAALPLDPQRQIHLMTLVFERLNEDGRRFARQAALRLLSDELRQNVYIAVFTIDQRLSVLQPFTSDRALLRQAIELATAGTYTRFASLSEQIEQQLEQTERAERVEAQAGQELEAGRGSTGRAVTAFINATANRIVLNILRRSESSSRLEQGRSSIFSLLSLFNGQRSLPGRKTLIYFSEGLQVPSDLREQFQAAISAANRSNVSVYAVDARGLVTASQEQAGRDLLSAATRSSLTNTTANRLSPEEMRNFDTSESSILANVQSTLAKLAEDTGGSLISDTNDLRTPMQRITEDIETYYELAYVPRNLEYDGRFRRITLKLSRPAVRVQSRSGYFALPPSEGAPLLPYEMPMLTALNATPLPHAFDYHAAVFHFARRADAVQYALVVEVPLKDVTFTEDKQKSVYRAHFSVLALFKNAQGSVVEKFSQDQPLEGPLDQLAIVRQANYVVNRHLLLAPGRYALETAALDRETMKVSARRMALMVMPSPQGIAMSSVSVIRRVQPATPGDHDSDDPLRFQGGIIVPSLGDTIQRGTGSGVSLYFVVYPSAALAEKPQLTLEYYRDGQLVARATPDLPAPDDKGRISYIATSSADSFAPGQYDVHAVVQQGVSAAEGNALFTIVP